MRWTLAGMAQVLGLSLSQGDARRDDSIGAVLTDSRLVGPGDVFVALAGSRVNGHDFLAQVKDQGAVAAVVTRLHPEVDLTQLLVPDAVAALAQLAAAWRAGFALSPCVLVTGSNGKTSVKEMLAVVLRQVKGEQAVLATQGNLNNHLGLPMTLLSLRDAHRAAVVEVGANHVGEISALAPLVRPTVAMITSIGLAHVGEFGGVDRIIQGKGEVFSALGEDGVAVVPAVSPDSEFDGWPSWQARLGSRRVVAFGALEQVRPGRGWSAWVGVAGRQPEGSGQRVMLASSDWGSRALFLPWLGAHQASNLAGVAAALLSQGCSWDDLQAGLNRLQTVPGRLQGRVLSAKLRVIDDSYNANPTSVSAAIAVLAEQPGERWLVLGNMGELGEQAQVLHADVGLAARAAGLAGVLALGDLAAAAASACGEPSQAFAQLEPLVDWLWQRQQDGREMTVLVKGSRSSRMERVVAALAERAQAAG